MQEHYFQMQYIGKIDHISRKHIQNYLGRTKVAWCNLCLDLKETRWVRGVGWFLFLCWIAGLVAILFLSKLLDLISGLENSPCQPDNTFSMTPQNYNIWTPSNVFEVTLGMGELSFATAKLIDVIWDGVRFSNRA